MAEQGPYAQSTPWQDQWTRPGVRGLILPEKNTPDAVDVGGLLRMVNLQQRLPGPLEIRPGQQRLSLLPGAVHSLGSGVDPTLRTVLRIAGVSTTAYSGNAVPLQTGLSGRPLTILPFYVENSDDPWLIVADGNRMFKVRVRDQLVLPLGLPAPAAPAAAISDVLSTRFAAFDASDNTQAANWTATAGQDQSVPPVAAGAPVLADVGGMSGNAVQMTTDPGGAATGYSSVGGVPIAVNASILQGSPAFPASDDDLVHLWIRIDLPALVEEVRVYLVCSAGFDPAVIPGQSDVANQDAYVRAFRPSDWTDFVEGLQPATDAGQVTRTNLLVEQFADQNTPQDGRAIGPGDVLATQEISRQTSTETQAGRAVWSEMGAVGVPLRRGDFARLGTTANRDWSTLTGLVVVVQTNTPSAVQVSLDDFFLTGGFGPDTSDPGAAAYTYKVTNFDPRTGAESNGSAASGPVNPARNRVTVQPAAASDPELRQGAYRFGGTNTTDWTFVGYNTSNGGQVVDTLTDAAIEAAPAVPTDHDQPVSTVDSSGNTVLAQPVPVVFGPLEDMVFAVGDPYRPGALYSCIPGEVDHWASDLVEPVCGTSEQLLNGLIWGGAGWVFSRERLYAIYVNLVSGEGQTVRSNPTACTPGLAAQFALVATTRGICYVAEDGIRITQGGPSELLTQDISGIFTGTETIEGVPPIDWAHSDDVHLGFADERLWLTYRGTDQAYYTLRYDFLGKQWDGPQQFAAGVRCVFAERPVPGAASIAAHTLLGCTDGIHDHSGDSDNGTPISFVLKHGAWDMGMPGPTKVLGDVQFDLGVPTGAALTYTTGINNDVAVSPAQTVAGLAGRRRYVFQPFGTEPQRARNLTGTLEGSSAGGGAIHQLGVSFLPEPLTTTTRPTPWEVFAPGEAYLIGCSILADTAGLPLSIAVEADVAGTVVTAATLTVQHTGRRKKFYSWPAVRANQARLRPTGDCPFWICFDVHYIYQDQPGRIAGWDTAHENPGENYYTGVDLECDTFGKTKQVEVWVDQVKVATRTVFADGRRVVHLTLTPGYGHIYRVVAIDANPGILYSHAWHLEEVPAEQTNWNQPITPYGTNADKYLKALVIRCDTFGVAKTLQVQADGVDAGAPISVTASGPQVVMVAFAPIQGRVFRILPTDGNPGRCWEIEPIFDEEPLCLTRWQTQRIDHGIKGWHAILRAFPCLRSTADVTLQVTSYNQGGAVVQTQIYTIPSTGGAKVKPWVPFAAAKGVLYEWLFTSAQAFYLYREESAADIQVWGGAEVQKQPFGTDDMDKVRERQQGPPVHEVPEVAGTAELK